MWCTIMMMCCTLFIACSSDDDDDNDNYTENNEGSSGSDNSTVSLAKAEQTIIGIWVDAAEYSQWQVYMKQGNESHASTLMNYGLKLSSGGNGAYLSSRLDNSFTSWKKIRYEFTWKLLSWNWSDDNSGSGKVILDGTIYNIYFSFTTNSGTQLMVVDDNGYLLGDVIYTRIAN